MERRINRDWEFYETGKQDTAVKVTIPHTFNESGFNYCDEADYQKVCDYRKIFSFEKEWENKEVYITIDGAAHEATVYINGHELGTHRNGYTAFTYNLTEYLNKESDNELIIRVDSREQLNQPPFGNVIDYQTYGGIYREVYITIVNPAHTDDIFAYAKDVKITNVRDEAASKVFEGSLTAVADITYLNPNIRADKMLIKIKDLTTGEIKAETEVMTESGSVGEHLRSVTEIPMTDIKLWDIENPYLYSVTVQLMHGDNLIDEKTVRTGLRKQEFKADGFYLNDRKVKLLGLDRHQSYAYVGYAMPERMQKEDAEILKYELGVNAIRTSHYPQHHAFLDRCDEIGLLVFTEIPGWQHIGDDSWKDIACDNVGEMVSQYRNHPSIILWGVRINESVDDDKFYERTNRIAHELDPSRSTSGVRYLQKSSLLEDVYAYNDFIHNGTNRGVDKKKKVTSDMAKPYLVSEFNGHMFPTKSYDCEEHRLNHALRHATVLDEIWNQEDISGGFGWCMFDYNTHREFGSGDRICYHGVTDMFRNPKMAAAVYASQYRSDTVFEVSSSMDIGEHPACNLSEIYVFTNVDSVKVYKNDEYVREYTAKDSPFKHLPHPPILMNDFVGDLLEKHEGYSHKKAEQVKEILFAIQKYGQNNLPVKHKLKMLKLMMFDHMTIKLGTELYGKYVANWGGDVITYRFDAIKDGEVVKSITKAPATKLCLEITQDTDRLCEGDTYDVSAIRLKVCDQYGNMVPFLAEPVMFKAEGAIELIGPSYVTVMGGMGGCYVKTTGKAGEGRLTASCRGVDYTVNYTVDVKKC